MAEQDLYTIAFPTVTETQMLGLERYADATPKKYPAGEAFFQAGDRDPKFYVIKTGAIEIVDITGEEPKTLSVQGLGNFTATSAISRRRKRNGGPVLYLKTM